MRCNYCNYTTGHIHHFRGQMICDECLNKEIKNNRDLKYTREEILTVYNYHKQNHNG